MCGHLHLYGRHLPADSPRPRQQGGRRRRHRRCAPLPSGALLSGWPAARGRPACAALTPRAPGAFVFCRAGACASSCPRRTRGSRTPPLCLRRPSRCVCAPCLDPSRGRCRRPMKKPADSHPAQAERRAEAQQLLLDRQEELRGKVARNDEVRPFVRSLVCRPITLDLTGPRPLLAGAQNKTDRVAESLPLAQSRKHAPAEKKGEKAGSGSPSCLRTKDE